MKISGSHHSRTLKVRLTVWFGGLTLLVLVAVGFFLGRLAVKELTETHGLAINGRAQAAATQLSNSLRERELEIALLS